MEALFECIRHLKIVNKRSIFQKLHCQKTTVALNDGELALAIRAQDQEPVHGAQAFLSYALREIDQSDLLLAQYFLHRIALVTSQGDAGIFEVKFEAVDFERL